jgi:hypothetical protein
MPKITRIKAKKKRLLIFIVTSLYVKSRYFAVFLVFLYDYNDHIIEKCICQDQLFYEETSAKSAAESKNINAIKIDFLKTVSHELDTTLEKIKMVT